MESIWNSVVKGAAAVGQVAGQASLQAKLKADLMFIDRELLNRQYAFGIQLYDYVAPLAKHHSFYSSDDTLTSSIQPHFIAAQREIAALEIKVGKLKERVNLTGVQRAASCTPATTWQEKLANAGKSTAFAGKEVKLTTELSMVQGQIARLKQEFGVKMYTDLERLEDTQQWLPTDREIRSFYDICRRDIEKIRVKRAAKEKELVALSGGTVAESEASDNAAVKSDVPPWGASSGTDQARISPPPPSNGMSWASTQTSTQSAYQAPVSQSAPPVYEAPVPQLAPPVYQAPVPQLAPPAYQAPIPQPAPPVDPFAENSFFDVVPTQTPNQQNMHDPFAITNAPASMPPHFPQGTFDPFAGNTAPSTGANSVEYDPFAGL